MALSARVGYFVKIGGTTTQAITGVGFRPKAILLFTTYQSPLDTFQSVLSLAYAISDGVTTFGRASIMNHWAGASGTFGATRQANAFPILNLNGSLHGVVEAEAAVVSLDADGFTLNWTTNDGSAIETIMYLAFGGSDLANAAVLGFSPSGRVGRQSVSGLGFRPNAVLFLPGFGATLPDLFQNVCHHALGCAVSSREQWALFGWSKGTGSRPAYTARFQRDDRCIAIPPDLVSTGFASEFDGTDFLISSQAKFVSRDLDGFTIDWLTAELSSQTVYCLGLKGGRYGAGSYVKRQGSQTDVVDSLHFQPSAILLTGDARHEDQIARAAPVTENKITLGVSDGANTFSAGVHDLDGAGLVAGAEYPITNRIFSTWLAKVFQSAEPAASALVAGEASLSAFTAAGFNVAWSNADALRRQFLYFVAGSFDSAAACSGGGAAPTITDPPSTDVALAYATTPLLFVELALDSGTKRYAQVPLPDPSTYYGGFKEARLLSVGAITRSLSSLAGAYKLSSTTVVLEDTDFAIRTLEAAGSLMNRRLDVYALDDADRRAGNAARRLGSFVIRRWTFGADLTVSLDLEDWFGSQLSEYSLGRTVPQNTFSDGIFSGIPTDLIGVPEPIGYGSLSDEADGVDAVGVVPVYYTGQEVVNGFHWDRYVVFGHAVKSIQSWFASDLGSNPEGTPRRVKMPATTEGVDFLIPGNAGWNAHTGSTNRYRDYGGRRYTVIFARGPRSDQHKDGTCQMTLNVCGIETVGDGSGTMIDGLPNQIVHLLTNQVAQNYLTGAWLSVPSSNGYSQLASVALVNLSAAARLAGGYKGAFILGGSRGTITVEDLIRRACQSADVQIGINRHGQLTLVMENAANAAVAAFTDINDIDDGGIAIEIGFDEIANNVPYRYGPRYAEPASKNETEPDWLENDSARSGAAITAHRQTKDADALELLLVRDASTGDDVVSRVLARRTGVSPYRGPVYAAIRMGLIGAIVDLGDNVTVTHYAGVGATGWSAQLAMVEGVTVDPMTWAVTLRVRAL